MPITEEQRRRAEANRLVALAKRKAFTDSNSIVNINHQQQLQHNQQQDPWRLFKCRKLHQDPSTHLPEKFRVRLEICSPDSFSITPLAIRGFMYPGEEQCLMRLNECLSNVLPTHYTQNHGGGKACVYKLRDYDMVLACLKNYGEVEIEKVPFGTLNVVQRLSNLFETGRWGPCRPEHLTDEKVDELIGNLPRKLLDSLLPFQFDGLRFGLQRGGRCLIADEMGLGKTLQAIAIAGCFINEGSVLVVCPAILRFSWAEELERWLLSCSPSEIHLVFGHRDNPAYLAKFPRVVVISYKMLHHLRKSMIEQEWALVIIDESHHLRCSKKKSESEEVKAVIDIATNIKRIVLLSGTPSLSRPFDIFHQINILWPGLLGQDKYDFAKTYCSVKFIQPSEGKGFQDFSKGARLEELNVLLRQTVMIRRLKEHVLKQLPPKRRQIIRLLLKRSDIISAKAAVGSTNGDASEGNPAEAVNSETLNEPDDSEGCCKSTKLSNQELGIAKLSGFREWLSIHPLISESEVVSEFDGSHSSQKMIIFAHHHKVLDGVQEFLCEKHVGFVRIDGNTLPQDRQSAVLSFKSSDEVKIAIIGITAGGVGLDFSSAQNVVFLELPLSPSLMLQAEDRAHRRGQTSAVNVYIFCAKDTMDERHWQNLNKSLHRVSSTTNGKYDAVPEIAVDGVSYLETFDITKRSSKKQGSETPSSSLLSAVESVKLSDSGIMQDTQPFEKHDKLSGRLIDIEESSSSEHTVHEDDFHLKGIQDQPVGQANMIVDLAIEKEFAKRGHLEGSIPEPKSVTDELLSYLDEQDVSKDQFEKETKLCPLTREVDNEGAIPQDEVDTYSCDQVTFLRFEVSKYTGRIHLYSCIPGTDSRPRPLFENFRQEELESLTPASNKNKETASGSFLDNPANRHALFEFIKEWNQLRPIERRKLVGKTLQLPLSVELCYLNENNNHNSGGLLKGGSKRRTTPWQEISLPLPPNAVWKNVNLSGGRDKKENQYTQAWTLEDDPLCKLCQKPCMANNAKTPEYFEDLFCNLSCYEEYRIRTSGRYLRRELFQIEHGICTNCQLDCHKLVKTVQPLSVNMRREYIERVAPKVASRKKLLEKLVNDPSEGNAWHADHIVPVYRGGGECRLENMRTLCVACHYDVTKKQCAERRIARAKAKKQLKEIMTALSHQQLLETDDKGKMHPEMQDDIVERELLVKVPGSSYSEKEEISQDSKDVSDIACQTS